VFSSEYVFDGAAGQYAETAERHPINEYGRQKVELEDLALASGRALVCRTSGVFGYERQRKNFVTKLVDHLREGQAFDVPSDQLITPTYAPSLGSAVVDLVEEGATGIVHTAGPRILSRADFSTRVAEAFGLPTSLLRMLPTSELGLVAQRPLRCGLNVDLVKHRLGHPLADAQDALRELAATGTI
jgi:dTDP-4-dehydrorhamnose reductase